MSFRILLIDDSRMSRQVVKDILMDIEGVEICAEASNGEEGINRTILERPDLILLDIEMPGMNGLDALANMRERGIHTPTLMLSSLTQAGVEISLRALELGALDFIPKPSATSGLNLYDIRKTLTTAITEIMQIPSAGTGAHIAEKNSCKRIVDKKEQQTDSGPPQILVIGSSTGGPQALQKLIPSISGNFPLPIVIIQHMPPVFTATFAKRLNGLAEIQVKEAETEECLLKGCAYVAPGGMHFRISGKKNGALFCKLDDDARVNSHRPSIDITLHSMVEVLQGSAAALIMTGMGKDGAAGMLALCQAGGQTFAQDEESSVIFGMNRQAINLGAIREVLPLSKLAERLNLLAAG